MLSLKVADLDRYDNDEAASISFQKWIDFLKIHDPERASDGRDNEENFPLSVEFEFSNEAIILNRSKDRWETCTREIYFGDFGYDSDGVLRNFSLSSYYMVQKSISSDGSYEYLDLFGQAAIFEDSYIESDATSHLALNKLDAAIEATVDHQFSTYISTTSSDGSVISRTVGIDNDLGLGID